MSEYYIDGVEILPHDLLFIEVILDKDGNPVRNKKIYGGDIFRLRPLNFGGELFERELQVVWCQEIKNGWIVYSPDRVFMRGPNDTYIHNLSKWKT